MKLQTKVTLGSVLLPTLIVTLVSGVDLYSSMQLRLQSTYERAEVIMDVARFSVIDTLNSHRDVPLTEALRDQELKLRLLNLLRSPNGVLSIDVVSNDDLRVIASTLDDRVGTNGVDADFEKLVSRNSWLQQLDALIYNDTRYYMLQDPVGSNDKVLVWVRAQSVPISPMLRSRSIST